MLHKRKQNPGDIAQLEMTPMIDVIFQLLIFFIVTIKHEDILSRLMASRPEPDERPIAKDLPLINIVVHRGGFLFRGQPIAKAELERTMAHLASYSKSANVLIRCTADSPHQYLVQALDICNQVKMTNLSVFSM